MKHLIMSACFLLMSAQAMATEITPQSIIGSYKVNAWVGFKKAYFNFKVLGTSEFEIQRYYPDGHKDQTCNGTYTMRSTLFVQMGALVQGKIFKGVFTCPDDRSKNVHFNIDYNDKNLEDLIQGTKVVLTSSLAPGIKINAFVKRQ